MYIPLFSSFCRFILLPAFWSRSRRSVEVKQLVLAHRGSELAFFQDLLHGLSEGHLTVAARKTLPGEKVEPRRMVALHPLTCNIPLSELLTSLVHDHLKQMGVRGRGSTVVVGVALPRAASVLPAGAFPQVLEGSSSETRPDLEVIGEQEKLPALFHFSLDLQQKQKFQS